MLTYTRSVWLDAPLEPIFRYCTSRHGFARQFPFDVQWLSEKACCSKELRRCLSKTGMSV
jgi:putative cell division inhibitor SULA